MPVTDACNLSCLGGCDQEDQGSSPAQANSSQDPIPKITNAKWTGGVAQAVSLQVQSPELKPQFHLKKKCINEV
jgi:hypothetical protein